MTFRDIILAAVLVLGPAAGLWAWAGGEPAAADDRVARLAEEVRQSGWIVYSARGDNGTWDLFLSRPDGSEFGNISNTPEYEEAAPRFSPDGRMMLYRRMPKGTTIDHDKWGFQGRLVICNPDGSSPRVLADKRKWTWATWSPDAKQIVCLVPKGIEIVDLATEKLVRRLPREGIYQQLFWSPDGKWFCGVANHLGERWAVARLNAAGGELNLVHRFQSCTPDWFPDSRHIIFSSRPANQSANRGYGWTQLWMADGEGKASRMVYGEDGYHIYGGALSPDGKYVLFSKCPADGGGAEVSGAPICLMRLADAPAIGGASKELRKLYPEAKDAAVLELPRGWEPCWGYAKIGEHTAVEPPSKRHCRAISGTPSRRSLEFLPREQASAGL